MPGGFAQIVEAGSAADKFRVFDFKLDATSATTFWTGNLFAFVLGLATGAAVGMAGDKEGISHPRCIAASRQKKHCHQT